MRAVVLGLVGAVLQGGAAQAGECSLTAPMVASSRAQWPSDLKRPDLIGKTFIVEKIASVWHPAAKRGHVAYMLKSGDEGFVAVQSIDIPTDVSHSFSANDPKAKKINWGARNKSIETDGAVIGGVIPDDGPLANLYLEPKC